jgi:hypothetical protein
MISSWTPITYLNTPAPSNTGLRDSRFANTLPSFL